MNRYDVRYIQLQQEKLDALINKEVKVTHIAKEFGVTRKTVYQWLIRYKQYGIDGLLPKKRRSGDVAHNRTSEYLEKTIITLVNQYKTEGVQSLADILYEDYKITLHPTTIYRILKRNDIRYGPYHMRTHRRWKKKLYSLEHPGTELQMDTMYPFGYKSGKVVYTIIDDASRWVYVETYDRATAHNTKRFLQNVIVRAPFTIKKIRTDNGTEFINHTTHTFLKNHNITHRRNTVGCPEQNGKIERFHQTIKRAFRYGIPYNSSIDDLQYKLILFLQYYNNTKKHRGLGMNGMTPREKLKKSVTCWVQ